MSEWIEWAHCGIIPPVGGKTKVEVRLRDGSSGVDEARFYRWDEQGTDGDIVAYRVLESAKKLSPTEPHDPVNKPSHYMLFPEQSIEFIDVRDVLIERLKDFTPRQIDYWSRAFEYLARAGGKNGVEDIKKAKWYLDRLVGTLEE